MTGSISQCVAHGPIRARRSPVDFAARLLACTLRHKSPPCHSPLRHPGWCCLGPSAAWPSMAYRASLAHPPRALVCMCFWLPTAGLLRGNRLIVGLAALGVLPYATGQSGVAEQNPASVWRISVVGATALPPSRPCHGRDTTQCLPLAQRSLAGRTVATPPVPSFAHINHVRPGPRSSSVRGPCPAVPGSSAAGRHVGALIAEHTRWGPTGRVGPSREGGYKGGS